MKWSSSLALSVAAAVSAAPSSPLRDNISVYRLKLTADHPPLNGKYLSLFNGTVGVFAGSAPLTVTPRRTGGDADADAKFELHQYPVGIIDHALALVGPAKASLRSLSDLTNPGAAASAGSTGPAADWTSFTLTRGSLSAGASAGGADRATTPQAPQLSYAQKGGKWLALPKGGNDWTVSWYDGNGVVMYTTMPVNITYEAVADA